MRFATIDTLRGGAALAVLLYHAQGFWRRSELTLFGGDAGQLLATEPLPGLIAYGLFGMGFFGVQLFFVVSGFCIHFPFASSGRSIDGREFALKRFWRLYPAYAVVVFIAFALEVARTGIGAGEATLANLVGNLAFWYYSFPPQPEQTTLIIVFWSLSVEVQFYIVYALSLPMLRRVGFGRAAIAGVGIGVVHTIVWAHLEHHPLPFFGPHQFGLSRFGEWLLGAWVAERAVKGERLIPEWAAAGNGAAMIALGVVGLLSSIATVAWAGLSLTALDIPGTVASAAILAGLVHRERSRPAAPPSKIAQWLSDRSYSLYLIHLPALAVIGEIYVRFRGISDKGALGLESDWAVVTVVGVVASLVLSDLLYRSIERPSHARARLVGKRGPPRDRSRPEPS
jgi:peptidoglycan/LPS O-acetylase OafA/YrhL